MEIRTDFPRFQEYFTLIIQFKGKGKPEDSKTTGKMYVGRYFTLKGEFDEVIDADSDDDAYTIPSRRLIMYLRCSVTGGIHQGCPSAYTEVRR
jgi:hypothetical protein